LAARNAEQLEEVSQQCHLRGGKAIVIPTNVADQAQCKNLIENTVARYGWIDFLIDNAGFGAAIQFVSLNVFIQLIKSVIINYLHLNIEF